jgi:hypothetical protein
MPLSIGHRCTFKIAGPDAAPESCRWTRYWGTVISCDVYMACIAMDERAELKSENAVHEISTLFMSPKIMFVPTSSLEPI